ncbi:CLUMA_CG010331, isoform A [Clunio marinus]|uniref:CLUMA_CG010331, isoform A n=1 Tax=Clunio marinus TaxID=568069 RepID=A0A1J1IF04_9DIPT|nr:CLUMA_CG010331, isoform A [Clunio marinus]
MAKSEKNEKSKLTEDQVDELKEAFAIYDLDKDGLITTRELGTVLRQLGQNPTEAEILDMIKDIDKDSTATISFKEFTMLMENRMNIATDPDDILDAFNVFDVNGNGLISANELRHVATNLGEKLTEDEANEMIRAADVDGDGFINYKDFINLMK